MSKPYVQKYWLLEVCWVRVLGSGKKNLSWNLYNTDNLWKNNIEDFRMNRFIRKHESSFNSIEELTTAIGIRFNKEQQSHKACFKIRNKFAGFESITSTNSQGIIETLLYIPISEASLTIAAKAFHDAIETYIPKQTQHHLKTEVAKQRILKSFE